MSRILSNGLRHIELKRKPAEVEPEIIKLQRYFREISGGLARRREERGKTLKEISFEFAQQTGLTYSSSVYERIRNLESGNAFQDCYGYFGERSKPKKVKSLSRDLTAYLVLLDTSEVEAREFIKKVSEKIKGLEYLTGK